MHRMKKNKAAGIDSSPVEFFQMVFPKFAPEEEEAAQPLNCLQEAVCHLMVGVWLLGHTPSRWATSIVTMMYKKGDEKSVSNYRTINLIPVLSKISSAIVWSRVEKELTAKGRCSSAQAGFMAGQEGIGQVVALRETCLRRRLMNLQTRLIFTDFATAFPSMPHEPMLRKLKEQGVRGKAQRHIRSLCRSPKGRVRLSGLLSELFSALRGSLEGCPLSPGAFKNFVDDILDELEDLEMGCQVPVGDGTYVSQNDDAQAILLYVVGLLFADDKVLLLSSRKAVDKAATVIIKWKKVWGMEHGVVKCATMCIPALDDEIFNKKVIESRKLVKGKWETKYKRLANGKIVTEPWTDEMQDLLDDPVRFEGQAVPVLGEHKCLGIMFHFTTALWPAYVAKAKALIKRRNKMAQFVSDRSTPLFARVVGTKSMRTAVGTHGAEMLGCPITKDATIQDAVLCMDGNSINKQADGQCELQAQLDIALQMMCRGGKSKNKGPVAIDVPRAELHIQDMSVTMAKQRVLFFRHSHFYLTKMDS